MKFAKRPDLSPIDDGRARTPTRGHSHMTSALRGKGVSSKADDSTGRLRDFDSDKGEKGSNYPQMLRTSFKYRPLVDPAVICGIKWLTNCKHVGVIGCIAWRDGLS